MLLERDLDPETIRAVEETCEHANPQHARLKRMRVRFDQREEPPVIKTWRRVDGWLSIPRGAIGKARELLHEQGYALRVRDERTEGAKQICEGFDWPAHKRTLYSDQEKALEEMVRKETCLLRSATASGKSTTCIALVARLRLPAIVVVWTGALFDQWVERVVDELGMREMDVGKVRGSKKRIGAVTIAMQQAVARMPFDDPFFRFFGVMIYDEVQRASAKTWFAATDPFLAKYRVGVSADERRADKKDFLTTDLFGPPTIVVSRGELVEKGRVRDVEIRVLPTGWEPRTNLDEVSRLERHKVMLDEMAEASDRDARVLEAVREEWANGEQILVFSLRVRHCHMLAAMLRENGFNVGLMIGGQENVETLRNSVAAIRDGRLRIAVGTVQAVGTGVDLPSVGVGIVAMPMASNKQLLGQVAGRLARIAGGTTPSRLYYLFDDCRRHDWQALHDDGRRVLVRDRGEWIDASEDKRRARRVACGG